MDIKTEPEEVYREFTDDKTYKQGLNLFENVKTNNNFYHGKQWEGLNAPAIEKPVFNVLKPSVNYMTSMLMTDDIGISVELQNSQLLEQDIKKLEEVMQKEVNNVFEQNSIGYQNREAITSCAIDGDTVRHHYWDSEIKTGYDYVGGIRTERIDNTNIVFGNHSTSDIQSQPYIILAMKLLTSEVREMAKANGITDTDGIRPDDELATAYDDKYNNDDSKYTTVLLKYWKQDGKVHFLKCTQTAMIQKETATDMELYPISYFTWEKVKHCCHGVSPLTAVIPNQVYINKVYALVMEYNKRMAFPKLIYDKTKLLGGWSNDVTKAVAVHGDPTQAVFSVFQNAPVNQQAIDIIESTIAKTKDSLGINDAALGNVKPDNTSAIVALQRASSQPLELQRMDFYQFIEDSVRIIVDMMAAYYGVRQTEVSDEMNNTATLPFDFSTLRSLNMNLSVEIGQATYWSELMQVQTLDNMLHQGLIDNAMYLELLPDGYIPGRDEIIRKMNEYQQQMMAQQMMGMAPQQGNAPQQGPVNQLTEAVQAPTQMM